MYIILSATFQYEFKILSVSFIYHEGIREVLLYERKTELRLLYLLFCLVFVIVHVILLNVFTSTYDASTSSL